jgi:hypothetical protein
MSDDALRRMLEKLDGRLDNVDITLARLTVSVEEHIRRTNILESRIDATNNEIKPIMSHVAFMNAAAKVGSILGALILGAKTLELF